MASPPLRARSRDAIVRKRTRARRAPRPARPARPNFPSGHSGQDPSRRPAESVPTAPRKTPPAASPRRPSRNVAGHGSATQRDSANPSGAPGDLAGPAQLRPSWAKRVRSRPRAGSGAGRAVLRYVQAHRPGARASRPAAMPPALRRSRALSAPSSAGACPAPLGAVMACEQIAWIREASSGARRARVGSNADSDGPRSARETCVHSRDAECDSSVGDLMPGRTDFERRGVRTLTRELPEGMAADQHRQVMKMQYYFRLAWKAAVLRTIRGGAASTSWRL